MTLMMVLIFAGCNKSSDKKASENKPGAQKAAKFSGPAPNLEGRWGGTLELGQMQLRVIFQIAKNADGSYTGTLGSPDQGAATAPITAILYNAPSVQIEADGLMAAYNGEFNPEGTEITGTWTQGQVPKPIPLILKRSTETVEAPPGEEAYQFPKGSPADIRGYWKGTLDAKGVQLRLALAIARKPDGTYNGTLDSLDQGARGLPLINLAYTNEQVHLEWKLGQAAFDGELSKDANEMSGQWVQMGNSLPIKWERTEKPFSLAEAAGKLSFEPSKGTPDIRGYWLGKLDVQQFTLRLALKIGRAENGTYTGTMDSLDQGAKDLPMTSVTFTNPTANLEWKGIGASFEGKLDKKGDSLAGTYKQGPGTMPITFTRTAAPAK